MHDHAPRAARALLAALVLSSVAAAQGPFAPGLRWLDGADLLTPWIPTHVAFGAHDGLVWVGAGTGAQRVGAYDVPGSGAVLPSELDATLGAGVDLVDVAAGDDAARLFTLTQREDPDIFHRRTEVARRDLFAAAQGAPFAPVWTHDLGFTANGPARFGCDDAGAVVVVAAWDDQLGRVRVDRLDGATGALLARTDLAGASLGPLALAADGSCTALVVDARLVLLAPDGAVEHDQVYAPAPASLAFDGAGHWLVVGGVGLVRVLEHVPGAVLELTTRGGPADEVAARVGISANAQTWAVAWWRFQARDNLRYEVLDAATNALVVSDAWQGVPGGLQNAPAGVRLSRDGARAAFASWGKGDAAPEVVLYDVPSASAVWTLDLPGSAMDLDLDATGTRLAVVTKGLHANLASSTGEVRLYDTGERDLTLLAPTRLGGSLQAAARRPGANLALYLAGVRAGAPWAPPGALGQLALARDARLHVWARPVDATGESLLAVGLGTSPGLVGSRYALQAAHRVGGQLVFGETTVDLLIH
ncbi:MAG: hypothetical protein H6828_11940 [Planctomycetes bacterium]|nr:hypothetical protein [Planctomycetota bacterium]